MIEYFFEDPMHLWLLGTAIIFTFVGMFFTRRDMADYTGRVIEATIDRMIQDGYLKTRRTKDGELELLKYNEE